MSRMDEIKARRTLIDMGIWQLNNADQREIQPLFWIAYAQGPNYPAEGDSEIGSAWAKASKDQEIINQMPADIDYLLAEVARLEAENAALKAQFIRAVWPPPDSAR